MERLEDDKVKFELTIDAAEVDEAIEDVYKRVNAANRVPGFRKGKAPKKVLDSNFGAEFFTANATVNLIEANAPKAVDEADMVALSDYEYDTEDAMAKPGEDLVIGFTIQVKPEMKISSAEPVEVKIPSPKATDAEIDAQIDLLRSYYIDLKQVDDRPVGYDDIISYSQSCQINGEPIEEGKTDKSTHVLGTEDRASALDKELVGMTIGEPKDITLPSSEFGLDEEYPLVLVTATVTILEITEKAMPELTDEWAKEACDAESVEALREQVGQSITAEKEGRVERTKSIECLEALAERLEGDVPQAIVQDCSTTALRNLYMSLQSQGITLDQYLQYTGQGAESFSKEMEKQGAELARQYMALDALARERGIEVEESDIAEAFEGSDVDDPQALRQERVDEHKMATLREEILRDKAARWLYDNAKVEYVSQEEYEALHADKGGEGDEVVDEGL